MAPGTSFLSGILSRVATGGTPRGGPMEQTPQQAAQQRISKLGMSPRQHRLNMLWARYMAQEYEGRKLDWDGSERVDPAQRELIAQSATMPPGYIGQENGGMVPVKFRRPSAPYRLGTVIPNRFTGLLFSEKRHPTISVEGDPDTEAFATAVIEQGRLWATMMMARSFGGAQGTFAVGFKFIDGKVRFEAFDPRFCTPEFKDRETFEVDSMEIRYQYGKEIRDDAGVWTVEPYWYRRTIDSDADTVYKSVPVGTGEEPKWDKSRVVEHGFGFCPVVWGQNLPLVGDIDGIPDCNGTFDHIERIDALLSQTDTGVMADCDATLMLKTNAALDQVKRGAGNVIKLPADGDGKYLESSGTGAQIALKLIDKLRGFVLEVSQCVLEDEEDVGGKTATETRARFALMFEKADVLREQYGQKGFLPLIEMVLKAARMVTSPVVQPKEGGAEGETEIVRQELRLPQKKVGSGDAAKMADQVLGDGGVLKANWPEYVIPTPQDTLSATQGTVLAKNGGVLDQEHAVKHLARHFGIEDVAAVLLKIKSEAKERQADAEAEMMGAIQGRAAGVGGRR